MSEQRVHILRYVLPNLVTSTGMILGLFAIMSAQSGHYEDAAWLILVCVLIDKLDGTAARLMKASSSFGVQLDSFSDFISFGLAPAFLIVGVLTSGPGATFYEGSSELALFYEGGVEVWFVRASGAFLVLMTAFRLAKFNVTTEKIGSKIFLGIPTTLVGATLSSYVLTVFHYGLPPITLAILAPALWLIGLWEVSNIPMPKVRKTSNMPYNIFLAINAVACYVVVPLQVFPEYLLALAAGYAVISPIYVVFFMRDERSGVKARRDGEARAEES